MMDRAPVTTRIVLHPVPGDPPVALIWVKQTYRILPGGGLEAVEPEPLRGDPLDEDQDPRLPAGPMDLWPAKEAPDLIIQGSVFAPEGRPLPAMEVSVRAGGALKRVAVFGRRAMTWRGPGDLRIEAPEPFSELPMTWENAYGGIDWRVPAPALESPFAELRLEHDHPGLYPRNPFGKGYLVCPDEVPGMEMPNLEDPEDLLTPGRLIAGAPERWYRQPLPACLDAVHPAALSRALFFAEGCDAWHPGPEDATMPEVARGILPGNYRRLMRDRPPGDGPHPRFFQEAAPGLTLPDLGPGATVEIRGMHPEQPAISFVLPGTPHLVLHEAGGRLPLRPSLHTVHCHPGQEKVSLVHGAFSRLTRRYMPGVHREIPLAITVNGGPLCPYRAPAPVRDRLAALEKGG